MQQALEKLGELVLIDDAIEGDFQTSRVLISTVIDQVDKKLLARLGPDLALIANIGVGTDNIDLRAAAERDIQVANTPVVTEDTADLTMALLLAASRRMSFCEQSLRAGEWAQGATTLGQRVHGKTLGIIGLGSIGAAVARRARGFEMHLVYHGPGRKESLEQELGATYIVDLEEFLAHADIVSLHCPLTDSTHHILDTKQFAWCKSGMVLVNTGRGPLINEQALIAALRDGQIAAAGLDVFEFEPQVSAELLDFDNVTALPHIGSATSECRADMAACTIRNIQSFLQTGSAENSVSF